MHPVVLTSEEREVLERTVRSRTVAQRSAQRARLLLLSADGATDAEVAPAVGISIATVQRWRSRFTAERLAGLEDRPRPGRPPRYIEADRARVISIVYSQAPPEGRSFEYKLHLIVDNFSAHKHENVGKWLDRHRHVHLHFTPTHASWLNQVELWFSILSRKVIRRGVFPSVKALVQAIMQFIAHYCQTTKPFNWTCTPEQVKQLAIKRTAYWAHLQRFLLAQSEPTAFPLGNKPTHPRS